MSALVICACRETVTVWAVASEQVVTRADQQPAEHAQHASRAEHTRNSRVAEQQKH